jgi:uncharacterized protein (DUF3084 family)
VAKTIEQMKARVYDLSMRLAQVQQRAREKVAAEHAEAEQLQRELVELNAAIAKRGGDHA